MFSASGCRAQMGSPHAQGETKNCSLPYIENFSNYTNCRASPVVLSMWPWQFIFDIQVELFPFLWHPSWVISFSLTSKLSYFLFFDIQVELFPFLWHPSLIIYFSATPTVKLKLGQQIGGEVLIANHLDESLWWDQLDTLLRSHIISFILFSPCVHSSCAFFQPRRTQQECWAKTIFLNKTGIFKLFFIQTILLCTITYWAPLEMLLQKWKVLFSLIKLGSFLEDWKAHYF